MYEGLVKLDNDGKIVPVSRRHGRSVPDRKTYTFDLTGGATFSNGEPFTAEDAVFSINRVKTDWTISLKSAMDVVKDAKALSPTRLRDPGQAEQRLALPDDDAGRGDVLPPPASTSWPPTRSAPAPTSSAKWNRGDSIALTRNDSYLGKKPYFQTVTLKYFKDPTALNNALLTGTINVIGTVQAPESLAQFSSNAKYQVIEGTTNGEVVLSLNNAKAPLNDVRVRQAVRFAIDHKALVDTCWAGRGKLIGSMVPPTDPWYEDLTGMYPHDVAKAKALLAAAGKTGVNLRLRLPTLPYATSCGQVVKSSWSRPASRSPSTSSSSRPRG